MIGRTRRPVAAVDQTVYAAAMTETLIRRARPEDALALTEVGRRTFVETFVEGFAIPYPEADLRAFFAKSFDIKTTRTRLGDPAEAWWVGERDGQIVAFANAGPNGLPHPEAQPSHAELRRLYVSKAAQGLGFGTRLFDIALDWMQTNGDGPLWIGVWSGNLRAQRLYAAYGFEKAGEYQYPVGDWLDDEFILRRS